MSTIGPNENTIEQHGNTVNNWWMREHFHIIVLWFSCHFTDWWNRPCATDGVLTTASAQAASTEWRLKSNLGPRTNNWSISVEVSVVDVPGDHLHEDDLDHGFVLQEFPHHGRALPALGPTISGFFGERWWVMRHGLRLGFLFVFVFTTKNAVSCCTVRSTRLRFLLHLGCNRKLKMLAGVG